MMVQLAPRFGAFSISTSMSYRADVLAGSTSMSYRADVLAGAAPTRPRALPAACCCLAAPAESPA